MRLLSVLSSFSPRSTVRRSIDFIKVFRMALWPFVPVDRREGGAPTVVYCIHAVENLAFPPFSNCLPFIRFSKFFLWLLTDPVTFFEKSNFSHNGKFMGPLFRFLERRRGQAAPPPSFVRTRGRCVLHLLCVNFDQYFNMVLG